MLVIINYICTVIYSFLHDFVKDIKIITLCFVLARFWLIIKVLDGVIPAFFI